MHQVGDSPFFVVVGFDAVLEATARPQDFSSNLTGTMWHRPEGRVDTFPMDRLGGPTQVLATADDPAHACDRKLVLPRLVARRIRELEPFVAATAERLLAHVAGPFDWMSALADRLPMFVVARLLGLPETDVDPLISWAYASTQLLDGVDDAARLAAAGVAATQLGGYLVEAFEHAAANPEDNLSGDFASYCAAAELGRESAALMLIQLVGAGAESTASLLGSAVWLLSQRPDLIHRLRQNPELVPAFLEETLRYESPFRGHYRHVRRATTLAGGPLDGDTRLLLLWGAAHRDPAAFDDPHAFRMDHLNTKSHLAFGKGAHFCLGAALARLKARSVGSQLLDERRRLEPAGGAHWLPSMLARRLSPLPLTLS